MSTSPDIAQLLTRLREPAAAERLVDRWIADLMSRRGDELVPPAQVAASVQRLLTAAVASDALHARVVSGIQEALRLAEAEPGRLRDGLAPEVAQLALELSAEPYSANRKMVLAVLDREPVRKLIRALLVDVLIEFGRRIAALASPLTGSRVGRGLGALGAIAGAVSSGVVGAVSGELERQVEKRATEFADLGISRVLQRLTDLICDASLSQDQSELRKALLDGLLDLTIHDLAHEARQQDPNRIADRVRTALRGYSARSNLQSELEPYLRRALAAELDKPLGEVLDKLGLKVEVEAVLRDALLPRAKAFDWAAWVESELGH